MKFSSALVLSVLVSATAFAAAPVLDPVVFTSPIDEGDTLSFTATATDPGDDPPNVLTFTLEGSVPGGAGISGGGVFSWTTDEADGPGTYIFDVVVTDDGSGTLIERQDRETITVTVNEVNVAPVLTPISNQPVDEGDTLNVPLSASDADSGDTLSFSETGLPNFCSLTDNGNRTGDVDCAPDFGDAGTYLVTITVSDGTANDSDGFNIIVGDVNQAPVLTPISNQPVDEGDTLNVPLSASDADSGDTLSFSETGLPNFCSLTDNGNRTGDVDCAPDFGDAGTYLVTITVSDGTANDSDGFNIIVGDVNQAPVLTPISNQPVDEGDTLNVPLSASDADSGDTLSFSETGLPNFCSLTDNGNRTGDVDCAPDFGDAGTYLVTITVSDGTANDSDGFNIIVGDVNQAPVLTPISNQPVDEGDTLNVPLSASDADSGDTLSFSETGLPNFCSLTDNGNRTGDVDCAPDFGDAGTYLVTITVSDGTANDSDGFNIIVGDVNQAPVLTPISNQPVDEGDTLNVPLSASDADSGDTLSFSETGLPNFCSLTDNGNRTGDVDCAPDFGDAGTYLVTITVSDGTANDSDGFNIIVGDVNQAPVLTPISNQTVDEGDTFSVPLSASDADSGDTLTFTASGLPGFCSLTDDIGPTGNLDCATGFDDAGTYPVTITVSDGTANDSDGFNIIVGDVNQAPVLTPISNQTVDEGDTFSVPLSASDADSGDTLTFTASGLPGFCSLTDDTGPTGNLDCATGFDDAGTYPVTITVSDGTANDSDGFNIIVGDVNQAPVLTPISNQTVDEGDTFSVPLSASDADSGDTLTFTASGLPGFCSLTDDTGPTGNLDCATGFDDAGTYPVTITVSDGTANDSDGFNIIVGDVNQAPVLTPISNQPVDEGDTLNVPLSASDADSGDTLTFTASGLPGFCSLTDDIGPTGNLDCATGFDDAGTYPVTITVSDGTANDSDGFNIIVGDVNQAPTANDIEFNVTEGESTLASFNVLSNDTDPDSASPALTAELVSPPALDPSFILNSNGTFSYAHDGSETSSDSFSYRACDNGTPSLCSSSPATVTIIVDNVNDAPVIEGQQALSTAEETALLITLADLLVTDVDSDPASFILSVQDGTNYTRVDNTITPALDFNGDLTVPVTVNDGESDSAVFNLVVTVTPVNDAPVIVDQAVLTTPEDTSLTVVITDVTVVDPDNVFPDDFTLELFDGANYTRTGNTITPDLNFNGPLSVPATVSDGELTSVQFILTIDVSSENDQPVLETPIEDQLAIEGTAFSLDISSNFTDADGDPLQFTAINLPASGNLVLDPATGVISGTPQVEDARDTDPYIIIVTATDGDPATIPAEGTFELNISALDRANISLDISVAPDPAVLNDELSWTFTASNTVGPQIVSNVELTGSFVGSGLSISSTASCTIQAAVDQVTEFDCTLGSLAIGAATSVVLTTVTSAVGDVVVFATAANVDPLPLDPNLADNSRQIAVGVAEEFSNGAVEVLGNDSVLSMAAGDINGDGAADLVIGTVAGQPIQVYLSDGFRDFLTPPISLPDTSANEGVALADFDNNGTLDLVVANGGGQPDGVYSNDGVGNFTLVSELGSAPGTAGAEANFAVNALPAPTSSHDAAVTDFNGDGNMDIVIATIEGNPVYLGDGFGTFSLYATLGIADSHAIAVGDFDGTAGPDIAFANVGSDSQIWLNNGVDGFASGDSLPIGDAVSVTVGQFGGDARLDLAFGRVPTVNGDVPANPVLINDGSGSFGTPVALLGTSATNDILVGDVNSDGLTDLVFINTSGVHQIWTATGSGFELHGEQIVDGGALVGVLTELGFTDVDDPGGVDLALGGALQVGTSVYLNDGFGNLGRGDAVSPVLILNGGASVDVPAGSNYVDAGATAEDNIDGDISPSIVVTAAVNTALVGSYTVTYNVTDFAGNSAAPITRTVNVTPAAGTGGGGGGGGAASPLLLLLLMLAACLTAWHTNRAIIRVGVQKQNHRGLGNA